MADFVVGICGASGSILGLKTIQALAQLGHHVHLITTRAALCTASHELGEPFGRADAFVQALPKDLQSQVSTYRDSDIGACVASGSFRVEAMLIVPCSMASLAAISVGLADTLLRRAADVTLKERRRLVIVPRETPLSQIHLENMLKLTRMGSVIVPPVPGWYTGHKTLQEAEDFIIGRVLDAAGLDAKLYNRWQGLASV